MKKIKGLQKAVSRKNLKKLIRRGKQKGLKIKGMKNFKSLKQLRKTIRKIMKDTKKIKRFAKKNPGYQKKAAKLLQRLLKNGRKAAKSLGKRTKKSRLFWKR